MVGMCDPAAWVSSMYVAQRSSGLLMLTLSVASTLYVWGRAFRTFESVISEAVLNP